MTMSRISTFTIGGTNVGDHVKQPLRPADDQLAFYKVTDVSLEKKLLQPNELRFTLRRDKVEKTENTVKFNIVAYILSKEVVCEIKTALKGDFDAIPAPNDIYKVEYKGTVVSATVDGLNIHCVALSKDYELSIIPHCNYFINKTLKEIVESIYTDATTRKVEPHFTDAIPYVVQYNETNYDFLVRLAKRYGEFFFFDQTQGLFFGKLPDVPVVKLFALDDFKSVQYELNSGDPNHAYVANHYQKEGIIQSALQDYPDGSNLVSRSMTASTMLKASIDLFYDNPNQVPFNAPNTFLNLPGKIWSECEAAGFVVCHCTTYRPDLYVGLRVQFYEKAGDNKYHNGSFIITSMHLTLDCNGSPVNEITAVGATNDNYDQIVPPYLDVNAYPRSSAQRAIVVDNMDPMKLGRVMVRFAWMDVGKPNFAAPDAERDKYPWIRIAQPYGGNNKGCYILPEINEEVMVGFEHDNMEKPFVIGTLFNKVNGQEQRPDENWCEEKDQDPNKGNEVKAFRTKNGHTIEFHDTDKGVGFIRIYNRDMSAQPNQNPPPKPNYDIILSTDLVQKKEGDTMKKYKVWGLSEEDQDVQAGEDLVEKADVEASQLRIMVKSYDGDIMLDAGEGDIILNAKNIRVHTKENRTTLIGGKDLLKVNGGQFAHLNSRSLVVETNQQINVKGESNATYEKKITVTANKDSVESITLNLKSLTSKIKEKMAISADEAEAKLGDKADVTVGKASGTSRLHITSDSASLKATNVYIEGAGANGCATLKGHTLIVEASGEPTTAEALIKCAVTSLSLKSTGASRGGKWNDQ